MVIDDGNFETLEKLVQEPQLVEEMLALMQKCLACEVGEGTEDSHIVADLLLARIAGLLIDNSVIRELVENYTRGIKDEWWHA